MATNTDLGIGDKVTVIHKKKDQKTGKTTEVTTKESQNLPVLVQIPGKSFCLECGGQLTPMLILYCQDCDQRYLAQQDEVLGKYIIIPLGKESEQIAK